MPENTRRTIETLLASSSVEDLREGLKMVEQEISRVGSDEASDLFEIVSSLFYLDTIERPDLAPILDEVITLVVGFGEWIIPALLEKLGSHDFKAQMAVANALGRLGADAITPLIQEYQRIPDGDRRVFIIYAFGKIKSPRIVAALPLVLEAARSSHTEFRDTATRTIGKMVESIAVGDLTEDVRCSIYEQLQKSLAGDNAGIRSKALRSMGKLAKYGYLNPKEREKLKKACENILGYDDRFDWDRAYIVRREAKEALQHCVSP